MGLGLDYYDVFHRGHESVSCKIVTKDFKNLSSLHVERLPRF